MSSSTDSILAADRADAQSAADEARRGHQAYQAASIATVTATATSAVTETMLAAFPKHAVGSWRGEPIAHHLNRARLHVLAAERAEDDGDDTEFEHAITRLSMALSLRRAARMEGGGR